MADKNLKNKPSNRKRKGKVRDNSLPLPDNTDTHFAFMRSNCGGSHFNIEIIQHDLETDMWSTRPAQAMLRGSIRKQFYSKAMPRGIMERIVLVEESDLGKQSSNSGSNAANANNNKLFIILHCYTVNEIKELGKETGKYLPPNYKAYTDFSRLIHGEQIDINVEDENNRIIQFESDDDEIFENGNHAGDNDGEEEVDGENAGDGLSDSENEINNSASASGSAKKSKGKDKIKKKKKSGGGDRSRGGGADWINSI